MQGKGSVSPRATRSSTTPAVYTRRFGQRGLDPREMAPQRGEARGEGGAGGPAEVPAERRWKDSEASMPGSGKAAETHGKEMAKEMVQPRLICLQHYLFGRA